MNHATLHPSIVALVSLAANIASNHPKQGLCQVDRLKQYGVAEEQIDLVVEIARHIRDEASQKLDASFDDALAEKMNATVAPAASTGQSACCTPTKSGQACC